ncbi:MAG: cation transporting ATPase C-terminal domain-containing protein, partial [Syntrophobacterales bacterium]
FQFFQAVNSRSEFQSIFRLNPFTNPLLVYALLASTFAQLAVIYAPPLQWVFRTVPLTPFEWVLVIGISSSVILVVEMDKWLRRWFGHRQGYVFTRLIE